MGTTRTIDETALLLRVNKQIDNLPSAYTEIEPGVKWGTYGQVYTPAYWKMQYLMHHEENDFTIKYELGSGILEEVVACLLGGYGLKSEMGLLAYKRLKERNLIRPNTCYKSIHSALSESFIFDSKEVRYRFPNQKAKYIFMFLNRNDLRNVPLDNDLDFRNWLLSISGIGLKTASWITRNLLGSERVAIIDIHIFRALGVMGFCTKKYDIQRDYLKLEELFLNFCKHLKVQPSKMDALIWLQMKNSNKLALKVSNNK